jgi:hypothetical protein
VTAFSDGGNARQASFRCAVRSCTPSQCSSRISVVWLKVNSSPAPLAYGDRGPSAGARSANPHLRALTCAVAGRASVGWMARKQMNSKQEAGWLWLPLIIGLIIGVTVAATTDQWWWSTVGVLGGAAFGWVSYARTR